jgi:hypothetical protein
LDAHTWKMLLLLLPLLHRQTQISTQTLQCTKGGGATTLHVQCTLTLTTATTTTTNTTAAPGHAAVSLLWG